MKPTANDLNHSNSAVHSSTVQNCAFALSLASLCLPCTVQAENAPERAQLSYKYLDYKDSQEDAERIGVKAQSVSVLAPIAGEWSLGTSVTTDSISGASPSYHTLGLRTMHDYRKAVDADLTRYFPNASLTLSANLSTESDYLSRGFSVKGSVSSADKNTTWTLGVSHSADKINPGNRIVNNELKQNNDYLLGLSQILTQDDIVALNFGLSAGSGYFSDPYKILDERPRERVKRTLNLRWNHHFEALQSTLRSSYRYYSDSWSIKSHTLGFDYVQPLQNGWSITPSMRIYTQSAASFYVDADLSSYPFPPNPPQDAVFFSEDQRLSAYGAQTYGIKISKQIGEDWLVDVKYEHYTQRANWRLGGQGSPDLQPFYIRSFQFGLSRQF